MHISLELGLCRVTDESLMQKRKEELAGCSAVLCSGLHGKEIPLVLKASPERLNKYDLRVAACINMQADESIVLCGDDGSVHRIYGGADVRIVYRVSGTGIIHARMEFADSAVIEVHCHRIAPQPARFW